jgi:hypothetical protein
MTAIQPKYLCVNLCTGRQTTAAVPLDAKASARDIRDCGGQATQVRVLRFGRRIIATFCRGCAQALRIFISQPQFRRALNGLTSSGLRVRSATDRSVLLVTAGNHPEKTVRRRDNFTFETVYRTDILP